MAQSDIRLGDSCLCLKSCCPLTIYRCPHNSDVATVRTCKWLKQSLFPSTLQQPGRAHGFVTAPQQRGAGTNSWSSSNLLNHHSCFSSKHPTMPSEAARRMRRWKWRRSRSQEMLWEPSRIPPLPQLKANRCAVTAAALHARPLCLRASSRPSAFFPCKRQKYHCVLQVQLNFSSCFYLPFHGNIVDVARFPAVFIEDWPGQARL